jgi:protein TonB
MSRRPRRDLRIPRLSAAELLAEPPAPPGDRLGLSLTLAIVLHALLILGVSFVPSRPAGVPEESLDVILVQERSEKPPGKADFLAQTSVDGGGDAKTRERPGTPLPSPIPGDKAELALAVSEAAPSPPAPASQARVAATESAADKAANPAKAAKPADSTEADLAEQTPAAPSQAQQASPTAAQLMDSSFAIASLNAEIRDRLVSQARGPRRKFVTSMTHEYKYAAYMESWRSKVERIGNLNYPEEARRLGLSGSLILDVALHNDGSIEDIAVRRSSGQPILDQAAIRIVKLASPFAKFPEDIKSDADVLHITRTWQFLNSNTFSSEGG